MPNGSTGRSFFATVLPGFWLRPDWLWQEPTPDPLFAVAEMRGLAPEVAQGLRAAFTGAGPTG